MYTTSANYDSKIYATSRQFKGKLEFELVDVDTAPDATSTVTSENVFSRKVEMTNLTRDLSGKYATFENDYWLLDGSFSLPPELTDTEFEAGMWSNAISDASGVFGTPQVITIDFLTSHDAVGITITFDKQTGECGKDFTIQAYDGVAALIDSVTVTNNTLSQYIWKSNLENFEQIVITITKTSNPYRRVRITEVTFGVVKEYTDNELIRMDILKEMDFVSNNIPADEVSFTLDNSTQEFNILNPTGIYSFLQKRQRVKPYYGLVTSDLEIEYIPMGYFYLTEWKNNQGALTATFRARDLLDIMEQSFYRKGKQQSRTLYDLVEDVLIDFGLTAADYDIDSTLSSITVNGNIPILSYKEAIQLIANAGECVVYSNRQGVIVIEKLTGSTSLDTIDFDDVYDVPEIKLGKFYNTVNIKVAEYTAKASPEVVYQGTITINGTSDVWIEYKEFPAQTLSSVITGATSVNSETYYGNAALLNITAAGNVTITTTGTVLEKSESTYIKSLTPSVITVDHEDDPVIIKLSNSLITDTTRAESVATWLLTEKNKRFTNEINWRQNPAHDLADIVTVEDEFSEDKISRITKLDYKYQGYLSGKTYTQGGD